MGIDQRDSPSKVFFHFSRTESSDMVGEYQIQVNQERRNRRKNQHPHVNLSTSEDTRQYHGP